MDWLQVLAIMASNAVLFYWNRSESRSDIRHMDTKLEGMRNLIDAIHSEMKDFHGRMCALEERNKK